VTGMNRLGLPFSPWTPPANKEADRNSAVN
jgi:hypothetical protein